MSTSIASHVGQEQTVEANGKTWTLARLTRAVWRDWFKWAKTVLPDPQGEAHKHVQKLAEEEFRMQKLLNAIRTPSDKRTPAQIELVEKNPDADPDLLAHLIRTNSDEQKHAATIGIDKAASHLSLDSAETQSLLKNLEGLSHLLFLLLKKHQPEVTPEEAYDVLLAIGHKKIEGIIIEASGIAPSSPKE